jgi:lipid II:glycine glycyltransferase (peptidoglycan interpeptide bridge formation enzyme)
MDKNDQNITFLQSKEWRKFQENVGRKTYSITGNCFSASIIKHQLPLVGNYLYIPRGPVMPISNFQFPISNEFPNHNDRILKKFKIDFSELIKLAKENNAGWIRIDPENEKILEAIKNSTDYKICKAPHDMQPKEIFVIDISKPEEELLTSMKQKTRYNIKIAQKNVMVSVSKEKKYVEEFLRLTKEMAKRNGITSHPEEYYRKMIEGLPDEMLKIYVAEYENKIIAANLILFFGDTATYLHGASGNEYRNVMAPYLLQWQAILDAKKAGYLKYDFGGIKSEIPNSKFQIPNETKNSKLKIQNSSDWSGITKFKLGFSLNTKPVVFPGSYDIIIAPFKYWLYRGIQKIKSFIK